jgi:hypothetical protein
MSTVRALLPALGAGFAFTLAGSSDKPTFDPTAGSSLTKTFVIDGEYTLDEISLIVEGQDMVDMLPPIEVTMKQHSAIEVTDTYEAVAGGRPAVLLRTFDDLAASMNMVISPAVDVPEMESTSALEGKTVAFRWNPEKSEYELAFHESEGEAELLEGLEEDMDLRLFLPQSEVAVGESWTVELTELQHVLMPGGNLQLMPEGGKVDEEGMKMFEDIFGDFSENIGDLLEGECSCTFKGVEEEGGVRLGEIAIELEVATNVDLAEMLDKVIRAAMSSEGAEGQFDLAIETADLNMDFEGSGTLIWNLSAGRMHSFQVSGDVTIGMDLAVSIEVEGTSQGMEASLEMSGSLREEVATKE